VKLIVTLELEHPEDVFWTQSFIVTMRYDKACDTGWSWWLEEVHPTPPTEAIEEAVMEKAVRMLDDATNAALDAAETARGDDL